MDMGKQLLSNIISSMTIKQIPKTNNIWTYSIHSAKQQILSRKTSIQLHETRQKKATGSTTEETGRVMAKLFCGRLHGVVAPEHLSNGWSSCRSSLTPSASVIQSGATPHSPAVSMRTYHIHEECPAPTPHFEGAISREEISQGNQQHYKRQGKHSWDFLELT